MSTQKLLVHAAAHPLKLAAADYYVPLGSSLQDIIEGVQPRPELRPRVRVFIGGDEIPMTYWPRIKPKHNALVTIRVLPGKGKKNPLATILSVAVMIAAPYAGAAFGTNLGLAVMGNGVLTAAQTSFFSSVVSGLVSVAGNLLVSAIAPPSSPKKQSLSFSNSQDSPALFIAGARNEIRPYAPVRRVLGFYRVYPDLGGNNYTEFNGADQYVRQLATFGYGELDITERKIGDTLLSSFSDVEIQSTSGADADVAPAFTLYPKDVVQSDLSIALTAESGWQRQSTGLGAVEIHCDIVFANGLYQFDDQGKRRSRSVVLEFRRSPKGANTWTVFETMTCTSSSTAAYRKTAKVKVPAGEYDIEVRRTTSDTSSDKIQDKSHWSALRYFQAGSPILHKGVAADALYMRATDQLNGSVDRYNALCKTVCLDWDKESGTWIKRITNNPASLYRLVLQDRANKRPVANAKIDLLTLQRWHEFCEENGYRFNAVYDFETTIGAVLDDICAAGRARRHRQDGLYTVVIDEPQTVAVQHFTPKNSWGYRYEVVFPDQPHGWRVPFINELKGYANDERFVYDDGYSEYGEVPGTVPATKLEQIEFFGVTHPDQIWTNGREHIATPRLRPFTHYFNCDAEILTANKGQMIRFSHDVILVGLAAARVRELIADESDPLKVAGVVLDDEISMVEGNAYGVRIRYTAGGEAAIPVTFAAGSAFQLVFENPILLGDGIQIGDLVQFGERGKETIDLIINRISFSNDLTALVECVDAAPGIALASKGSIPPFESVVSFPAELTRPAAPQLLSIQSDESVMVRNPDGSVQARTVINLRNTNAGLVETTIKIKRTGEADYFDPIIESISPTKIVLLGIEDNTSHDLRIFYHRPQAVLNATNLYSMPLSLNGIISAGGSAAPDNVERFRIAVLGNLAVLSWAAVENIDLSHYEIRFTPLFSGISWGGSQILEPRVTGTNITIPFRIGTYLIRAFDRGGNYSETFTMVSTGTSALESLNVVEVMNDAPDFLGTKTNLVVEDSIIKMDDTALLEGKYEGAAYLDLGAVYTSRLSVKIAGGGYALSEMMSTWERLSDLESLSSVDRDSWGIELQISTTNDDPAGSPVWSDWVEYAAGDYTFRAIKYQVYLRTRDPNVGTFISELSLQVDMPDRILGEDDITVPTEGVTIAFSPPFKRKKAINITPQDMVSGDKWEITAQSNAGFTIRFYNEAGTPVSRTMDWMAKGYGKEV